MNNLELYTKLDDGTPVHIRTLRHGDEDSIKEGFERISTHSKYLRYFSTGAKLTPDYLNILTSPDGKKSYALGASDLNISDKYGIGLARYILCEDESNTAEIAMVVVDQYQGRGLGSIFLDLLIKLARENGLSMLCGYVLPENRAMLRLLDSVNSVFRYMGYDTIRVDIPLAFETKLKVAV